MSKAKTWPALSEAELKLAAGADDGKVRTEEAMFAARMAGATIEVSGPAYVVAAVVAAVHLALKDF